MVTPGDALLPNHPQVLPEISVSGEHLRDPKGHHESSLADPFVEAEENGVGHRMARAATFDGSL
jgi:hypothetical protein